jgi:Dyp-type peroxidase family
MMRRSAASEDVILQDAAANLCDLVFFSEEGLKMPIKLDKLAKDVDIESTEYDVMRGNLQANILKPHGRDFARHIFVRFTGQPAAVRAWITGVVVPMVTTAAKQLEQIRARHTGGSPDGGTVTGFYLSAAGYKYLGFDTDRFASDTFRNGMKHQDDPLLGGLLGGNNKDPKPEKWEAGFQGDIHALVTVADDDEGIAKGATETVRSGLTGVGRVTTVEEGLVLRRVNAAGDAEPVEHFGYFDGISNPLFTKQDLAKERPENQAQTHWNPGARLSLVLTDDPFTDEADAFGSYLTYRKLGQDVRTFERRVVELAQALGVNPDLAGAMVVGRFKDGTPVVAASAPSPGPQVLNDFDYRQQDPDGVRCPAHAHIRKVNPRGTTPLTSLESERRRRIVRRGIPYGKPLPGVADPAIPTDPSPDAARGLLFMCFQQNIEDQFEFIQRTWVDNKNFPAGILLQRNTGDDPLIGQDRNEDQHWPKQWGDKNAGEETVNFESAVTLKGGEYFFAPSLPFLRSL